MPVQERRMDLETRKMHELFAAAKADLLAIPAEALLRPRLPRERVVHLTDVIRREFEPLLPRLADELSVPRAAERRADYEALEARALVYFAADLAVEEPWTPAQKARRAELAARVREHDEALSGWAIPLFRKDPDASAIVADILRGKGIRDDAEDTLRLAALFRSRWAEVAGKTPVAEAQLAEAESEAGELIRILDTIESEGLGSPRDLRRRAFTFWFQPYMEIFLLGRYLLRGDVAAAERFPGIAAERGAGLDRTPAPPHGSA
jgi:hypothetical protein